MPTYKQIQEHVRRTRGFVPKTCWIAHVLAEHGLTKRQAINRLNPERREHPCPEHRRSDIETALRELGVSPIRG